MNGNKLFVWVRNMEDMVKMKWTGGIGQDRFIDMKNVHICIVGYMYPISTVVPFMHGHLFQLANDVIDGP
jgi:hypothetical protein